MMDRDINASMDIRTLGLRGLINSAELMGVSTCLDCKRRYIDLCAGPRSYRVILRVLLYFQPEAGYIISLRNECRTGSNSCR